MQQYAIIYPWLVMVLICYGASASSVGSCIIAYNILITPPKGDDNRATLLWYAFWTLILGCIISALILKLGALLLLP